MNAAKTNQCAAHDHRPLEHPGMAHRLGEHHPQPGTLVLEAFRVGLADPDRRDHPADREPEQPRPPPPRRPARSGRPPTAALPFRQPPEVLSRASSLREGLLGSNVAPGRRNSAVHNCG